MGGYPQSEDSGLIELKKLASVYTNPTQQQVDWAPRPTSPRPTTPPRPMSSPWPASPRPTSLWPESPHAPPPAPPQRPAHVAANRARTYTGPAFDIEPEAPVAQNAYAGSPYGKTALLARPRKAHRALGLTITLLGVVAAAGAVAWTRPDWPIVRDLPATPQAYVADLGASASYTGGAIARAAKSAIDRVSGAIGIGGGTSAGEPAAGASPAAAPRRPSFLPLPAAPTAAQAETGAPAAAEAAPSQAGDAVAVVVVKTASTRSASPPAAPAPIAALARARKPAATRAAEPPAESPGSDATRQARRGARTEAAKVGPPARTLARADAPSDDPFAAEAPAMEKPKAVTRTEKPQPARAAVSAAELPSDDPLAALMNGAAGKSARAASTSAEVDRALKGIDKPSGDEGSAVGSGALAREKAVDQAPRKMLSRAEIDPVMRGIQDKARACYEQHGVAGVAEVKITITPAGTVDAVAIMGKFVSTPTGSCVRQAIKSAVFPASSGMRLDYRVNVR
jgi:hypothetical protein